MARIIQKTGNPVYLLVLQSNSIIFKRRIHFSAASPSSLFQDQFLLPFELTLDILMKLVFPDMWAPVRPDDPYPGEIGLPQAGGRAKIQVSHILEGYAHEFERDAVHRHHVGSRDRDAMLDRGAERGTVARATR